MKKRYPLIVAMLMTVAPHSLWAALALPVIGLAYDPSQDGAPGLSPSSSFGLNDFQSLAPDFLASESDNLESLIMPVAAADGSGRHRYSLLGVYGERDSVLVPLYQPSSYSNSDSSDQFQAWGVKWRHRLNADHSFVVSAHLGENTYDSTGPELGTTTSTMAALSWTTRLEGGARSKVTGSVFYGDETAANENELQFGRIYYGFTVGGQFTVYDRHTPYVSFKLQKSNYIFDDTLAWESFDDDYFSRLSAGWNWQVQRNWSLKAEANYIFNDSELDWRFNRSQLFFGTRYDFR